MKTLGHVMKMRLPGGQLVGIFGFRSHLRIECALAHSHHSYVASPEFEISRLTFPIISHPVNSARSRSRLFVFLVAHSSEL